MSNGIELNQSLIAFAFDEPTFFISPFYPHRGSLYCHTKFDLTKNYIKMLYPLKFNTIFKDKIWGGEKIKRILGKDFSPLPNCGETWELSGVQGNISIVSNGPLAGQLLTDLISSYKAELLGKSVFDKYGEEFPLLIKFIDANQDLSIQVHPDDEVARKKHNSFGKTEMWYIMQADEGATLITGFNRELDRQTYLDYFNKGDIESVLNKEEVNAGDVFYIPAGRVHTIGKGIMLAEIQQTSDVTYRIYDFDRKDAEGKLRELHVEDALDALDFKHYDQYKTQYDQESDNRNVLVNSPFFCTNKWSVSKSTELNYALLDSFVILIGLNGQSTLEFEGESIDFNMGEVCLIPASFKYLQLNPTGNFEFLEVWV